MQKLVIAKKKKKILFNLNYREKKIESVYIRIYVYLDY